MARKLISKQGGITFALFFLAAATLVWVASAQTAKHTAQWDDQASKELMAALHHTHDAANAGDIQALQQSEIGDNASVIFELDPDNVRLLQGLYVSWLR